MFGQSDDVTCIDVLMHPFLNYKSFCRQKNSMVFISIFSHKLRELISKLSHLIDFEPATFVLKIRGSDQLS